MKRSLRISSTLLKSSSDCPSSYAKLNLHQSFTIMCLKQYYHYCLNSFQVFSEDYLSSIIVIYYQMVSSLLLYTPLGQDLFGTTQLPGGVGFVLE